MLPAVLAVGLLIANVIAQHSFLSWSTWPVTLTELAPPALLAMASAPAILGGGIDISVAPLFAFVSVVVEVMLLGIVFLVGLGAVTAALIIVAMRLIKGKGPRDSTPLS